MNTMFFKRGVTKVQAVILVVVVIIAAVAVGAYYTTTNPSGATTTRGTTSTPKPVDKVTLQDNFLPAGNKVGFEIAVEKGFYKRQNMEVTISPGQGSLPTITNVAAGQFDFGYADSVPVILARAKGVDVKAVAALQTDTPMGYDFLLKSGIKTPKDLEGKRIASFVGDAVQASTPMFCGVTKIDCSKLTFINVAPNLLIQMVLRGEADVKTSFLGTSHEPTIVEAAKVGEKVGFIGYHESGLDIYGLVLFTTAKTIHEKPDLVRRFVTATVEGFKYALANPDEAVSNYVNNHQELNKELVQMQWQNSISATLKSPSWDGSVNKDKMAGTVAAVQQVYNLTAMDPQSVYTNPMTIQPAFDAALQLGSPIVSYAIISDALRMIPSTIGRT